MIRKKISPLAILVSCVFLCSCEDWMAKHLGESEYSFKNKATYNISVYSMMIPPCYYSNPATVYPDTTLPTQMPLQMREIEPNREYVYSYTRWTLEDIYNSFNTDTISYFVISTDTLEKYGWDSVRIGYRILQRYDYSVMDYYPSGTPTFPPTEAMRNIKMWPPYGTYDEHGNRVTNPDLPAAGF